MKIRASFCFSIWFYGFGVFLAISIGGCSGLRPVPSIPENGPLQHLRETACERNIGLKTFKGIGRIAWRKEGMTQHARLAWIGRPPDHLRLEVLDMVGRPALTLATDGNRFYALSHIEKRFETFNTVLVGLSDFISIDIPAKDVIQLLSGRMPISAEECEEAKVKSNPAGYFLSIQPGWLNRHFRIDMGETGTTIKGLDVFKPMGGDLAYQVRFVSWNEVDGYSMLKEFILSDADTAYCKLITDHCWVDIPVDNSIFTLRPPE